MAKMTFGGKGGSLFLLLFSLPFAAVGVGAAVVTWWTLLDWQRMQSWQEVPCRIVKATLESHHSDDSTTHKVVAEYRYRFDGREYTGTRVSPHSGSDNVGSFHQRVYQELEQHRTSGEPFRCYVDPEHPEDSILFRRPRWEMLVFETVFAYAFGAAGLGMLIGSLIWLFKRGSRGATTSRDEPWTARADWAQGLIRSSNRKTFVIAVGVALLGNVGYLPVVLVAFDEWQTSGNAFTLFALPFVAIGLALAWWMVYAGLRWLKFGESTFQMAVVPGVLGGTLAGVVHVASRLQSEHGFRLRLICRRTVTTRSGGKSSTVVDNAWEHEQQVAQALSQPDPDKTAIPVLFTLPYQLPPTGTEGNQTIAWNLEVRSAQSGVDYKAIFEVPVFRTDRSQADFQLDDNLAAPYGALSSSPGEEPGAEPGG